MGLLFVDASLLVARQTLGFGAVCVERVLGADAGFAECGELRVELAALLSEIRGVVVDTGEFLLGLIEIGADDLDLAGEFMEFALACEESIGFAP